MRILWPKRTADACEHLLVTDDPDTDELKCLIPRMVFPVALFPDPVLPISTILIPLSIQDSMPNLKKQNQQTKSIDDPDTIDLKCFIPRIVFPVALFSVPVLPISTILISFSMSFFFLKDEINQYTLYQIMSKLKSKIVKQSRDYMS